MSTITYTSTSFIGGGIAVLIMFTIISLFLAIYFSARDREVKAKYKNYNNDNLSYSMPKAPENILIISFCWFMFIISSYMSLIYILSTGELGNNVAYTMTTLYRLVLVIIFIFLLFKYREIFLDKLKEWGIL